METINTINNTINIYRNIFIVILCYFFGAVPFCYIIGKIHSRKDLTKIGDRNPGGWNLIFNVSKFWGIIGSLLDFSKGLVSYFLAYRFSQLELVAILGGCAAVAGHNYSPYLKFSGGKGLAATIGVFFAVNPFSLAVFGAVIVTSIFLLRNMIWSVMLAIIFSGIFLWAWESQGLYILLSIILLLVVIPKHINYTLRLSQNFKIRKEESVKDLFTPKIR